MTYLNALTLHPNNPIEQKKYLQLSFKKTMTKLKYFIKCNELDIRKESMTYVFEHIKPTIIKLISHISISDETSPTSINILKNGFVKLSICILYISYN